MARVLSETTYKRMMTSIGATEGMPTEARAPSARRIRSIGGGGGGTRSYVVITSVNSASSYVGDVITSPDDNTVITEDVNIKVENASTNAFEVGYSSFADKSKDGGGNDVYYLAALLLT